MALSKKDLEMIGDGMVKILKPMYEKLDSIDKEVKGIKNEVKSVKQVQEEHTDKIGALMAKMHDIHQEFGINKDKTDSEIEKIKDFVGLPITN